MEGSTERPAQPARIEEASDARPGRDDSPRRDEPPAAEPAPGIRHQPEPDAENIMPAKDEPGTL